MTSTQVSEARRVVEPGSVQSLSRPTPAWKITAATMVRGLQIVRRYLPNLIGDFVQLAIRLAFLLLIGNVLSRGGLWGLSTRSMFIFYQGAIVLIVFNGPTLWGPLAAVDRDLYNGTLEYLYTNPGSRYAYYVGHVLSGVVRNLPVFLPFYFLLVLSAKASITNMIMILLVSLTALVTLTALGIMIALLALVWRQVSSIAGIVGILFEFLGGAYLPLDTFPRAVRYLAYLLPYTWGYDLIRYYSFDGGWTTILPVWQEWSFLILYAILYTILSRYLLRKAEQLAKRSGLHII